MTCAKQTVVAVLVGESGKVWVGTNLCESPQKTCPRGDMPTGEGYELCLKVCGQFAHAEVNACLQAGDEARGGDMYIFGHTYACNNCKKVMREHGVESIVFPWTGET